MESRSGRHPQAASRMAQRKTGSRMSGAVRGGLASGAERELVMAKQHQTPRATERPTPKKERNHQPFAAWPIAAPRRWHNCARHWAQSMPSPELARWSFGRRKPQLTQHGRRDGALKVVSELEEKLVEARKAAAAADEEVKAAEIALAAATERDRLPETKATAIAKLVENALRRATGTRIDGGAGGSGGEGIDATASTMGAGHEVPIEEVVGLVKDKVDEILKQLEVEQQARAAERAGAPTAGATAPRAGWLTGAVDAADLDAEMELPPEQFEAEVDRRLAAKREQLLAANAAKVAKKAKTSP